MIANLNELAVVVSGATDTDSCHVNGVYLYQCMKDDKPVYYNISNDHYLYYAPNSYWTVSGASEEARYASGGGCCVCAELGLDHPSQGRLWQIIIEDEFADRPAVKFSSLVRPFT